MHKKSMNRAEFLPYYLTLFTFSAWRGWPSDFHFLEQNNFATPMMAFTAAQAQRFMAFSQGLQAYMEAPFPGPVTDFSSSVQEGYPLFILPSLVTSKRLLQVHPDHHFLNFLNQNGFEPVCMSWPRGSEDLPFEAYEQACLEAYRRTYTPSQLPFVLGIKEGVFFALSLVRQGVPMAGLVLMDEPQGVVPENPLLRDLFKSLIFSFLLPGKGMPSSLTRLLFSLEESEKVIQKITNFNAYSRPDLFIVVEDCLNEHLFWPSFLAKGYLSGDFSFFYEEKKILEQLQSIPTLLIQPQQKPLTYLDRILFSSQRLQPSLGSFGLLLSSFAPLHVWKPLVKWLQKTKKGELTCQVLSSLLVEPGE